MPAYCAVVVLSVSFVLLYYLQRALLAVVTSAIAAFTAVAAGPKSAWIVYIHHTLLPFVQGLCLTVFHTVVLQLRNAWGSCTQGVL
jgi:hypothetical protein